MPDITVDISSPVITVELAVGAQGPQGPAGPAGGTAVTYTAGETLAAGRVVIIDAGEAFLFQPSLSSHQGRAYGITTASAADGASVSIQIGGEIDNAAFTFTADRQLFVDTNGVVVDTAPVATIVQSAGVAALVDKMKIDFSTSVKTT